MTLAPLNYATAHVALNVPVDEPTPRTEDAADQLAAALHGEFDARVVQGSLPEVAPAEVVFLILAGRGAQIAFSQIQADLEIEFRDAYMTRADLCAPHVGEKMTRLLEAWERIGARPVWEGLVVTLRASTKGEHGVHVQHMLETHLRPQMESDALHDARLQLGLRLYDRYFVTLALGHYEARSVQRQVAPGVAAGPIRPWEGEVTDEGLELTVDINNRYGALLEKRHTRVTVEDLRTMNDLAWQLIEHVAIPFAHDGTLDLSGIQQAAV
jgi:hypothetical protein